MMGTWIVIHMARSGQEAERLKQKLTEEGILVRLKPVYKNRAEKDNYYELLVLHSEVEAAREIFLEKGF
jgi:hypothetical protein